MHVAGTGACPLSRRQLQVLRLQAWGLHRKQIAVRLGITESTIRSHALAAYRKLGVHNAVQALAVCFNAGWVDPVQSDPDPARYSDRRVTNRQRLYLMAFDEHLKAGDDHDKLEDVKVLSDAAARNMGVHGRSVPSRDWIDRLLSTMAHLG